MATVTSTSAVIPPLEFTLTGATAIRQRQCRRSSGEKNLATQLPGRRTSAGTNAEFVAAVFGAIFLGGLGVRSCHRIHERALLMVPLAGRPCHETPRQQQGDEQNGQQEIG